MGPDIHSPDGMRVGIPSYWPSITCSPSITTLSMTTEEKEAAKDKPKHPLGFAPQEGSDGQRDA